LSFIAGLLSCFHADAKDDTCGAEWRVFGRYLLECGESAPQVLRGFYKKGSLEERSESGHFGV
jgi:hypothetical protein